jgi:tetratricopeptide (TPR) repeat protein
VHPPAEPRSSWARLQAARTTLLLSLFTGAFTGLIAGLAPSESRAQTPPETETRPPDSASGEDKAKAKVYFERAETLKHSGSARAQAGDMDGARAAYAEAADVYLRAFELFPHAAFLYNAAQMHRLSGKSARAIAAYQRYVAVDPEGDKAEEARAHIAELRRDQAARSGTAARARDTDEASGEDAGDEGDEDNEGEGDEDADGAEDGEDEAGDDTGAEDTGEDAGAAAAADGEVPAALDGAGSEFDDEDEQADTGRPLRIGGLAAAAAGAITFGIGIKYGMDARSISDELSGPRFMWDLEDRELFAEGERAERNALILMGVGGAALVTGGALYLMGHNRDGSEAEDRGLGVSASATSDSASMLLWGRF